MVLYTTAAPENIFAHDPLIPVPKTVISAGLIMEVLPQADGSEVLSRLYSTDPACFLESSFAPGSVTKSKTS